MTGSRRPTSSQPVPSWSSDSVLATCPRTASIDTSGDDTTASPRIRSPSCQTTAAADPAQPSTGNAIVSLVASSANVPVAGVKPPRNRWADARLNRPRGSIVNSTIGGVSQPTRSLSGRLDEPPERARGVQSRPMAIYFDHAATTPLRREALDAMLPFLTDQFGNPSSAHSFGRKTRAALDEAHERVAARLHAEPREIIFTSGGTEANNLALKGAAWAGKARGHRIVTSAVEHHAVGHTLHYLEKFGFEIVELPVDRYGRVDPDQVDAAITDKTILVAIMLANNEVGTVQPIAEIGRRVRSHRNVLFAVDAVQAAPYVDIDVEALGADMLSIAAHKFEGP